MVWRRQDTSRRFFKAVHWWNVPTLSVGAMIQQQRASLGGSILVRLWCSSQSLPQIHQRTQWVLFVRERYTVEGEYLRDHVCLIKTNGALRTNESPLEELPIDMVHTFTLDYLHLLNIWVSGTECYNTKFSAADTREVSVKILQARETQPSDINCRCRSISYLKY